MPSAAPAVLQQLATFFGNAALTPRGVVEFNWAAEAWNRGCPVAVLGPGTLVDFGAALREPVGRLHWAGTETSTYWNGSGTTHTLSVEHGERNHGSARSRRDRLHLPRGAGQLIPRGRLEATGGTPIRRRGNLSM